MLERSSTAGAPAQASPAAADSAAYMTGQPSRTAGYTLAATGALGLAGSLWAPWYTLRFTPTFVNDAVGVAHQLGPLGPLITRSAQMLSDLGPLPVKAWDAYKVTPGILLAIAAIAGALALLTLTGRTRAVGPIIARVGMSALVITGFRVIQKPAPSQLVHLGWGLAATGAAAAAIVVGGLLATSSERAASQVPLEPDWTLTPPVAPPWPAPESVAPPAP